MYLTTKQISLHFHPIVVHVTKIFVSLSKLWVSPKQFDKSSYIHLKCIKKSRINSYNKNAGLLLRQVAGPKLHKEAASKRKVLHWPHTTIYDQDSHEFLHYQGIDCRLLNKMQKNQNRTSWYFHAKKCSLQVTTRRWNFHYQPQQNQNRTEV